MTDEHYCSNTEVVDHTLLQETINLKNREPNQSTLPTRSSLRLCQKSQRESSPSSSNKPDVREGKDKSIQNAKPRTHYELWSMEDKNIFFEALCEHGRDFDAIHHLFSQKYKKRRTNSSNSNPPLFTKTKLQIKDLYHRTWRRISKHIDFNEIGDINKHAIELYGLINYGELRKKIGGKLDEKSSIKFNELINKGSTNVKIKGKACRLRTPVCRALKKLNNLEESKEDDDRLKLPDKVTLEMYPRTNEAWLCVQRLAQNPRLRIVMKPNQRVSTIHEYLNKKWRDEAQLTREGLGVKDELDSDYELCLTPPESCKLHPFNMEVIHAASRVNIGLDRYREHVKGANSLLSPPTKRKKTDTTSPNSAASDTTCSIPDVVASAEPKYFNKNAITSFFGSKQSTSSDSTNKRPLTSEPDVNEHGDKSSDTREADLSPFSRSLSPTNNPSSASDLTARLPACPNFSTKVEPKKALQSDVTSKPKSLVDYNSVDKIVQCRNGLAHSSSRELTSAELFLLMKTKSVVKLEYEWAKKHAPLQRSSPSKQMNAMKCLVQLAVSQYPSFHKDAGSASPKLCKCGVSNKSVKRLPKTRTFGTQTQAVEKPQLSGSLTSDGVFRIPPVPPLRNQGEETGSKSPVKLSPSQILQQLQMSRIQNSTNQMMLPRRRTKLRRPAQRPVVVQRTLLPKSATDAGHPVLSLSMLPNSLPINLSVVQQRSSPTGETSSSGSGNSTMSSPLTSATPSNTPSCTSTTLSHTPLTNMVDQMSRSALLEAAALSAGISADEMAKEVATELSAQSSESDASADLSSEKPACSDVDSGTESRGVNAPKFSSLLDLSLPPSEGLPLSSSEPLIDMVLEDSLDAKVPNERGDAKARLMPEDQWITAEDLSLSQLLDTPVKRPPQPGQQAVKIIPSNSSTVGKGRLVVNPPTVICEGSRDSNILTKLDVDSTLQCMMNESSVDYMAKFADLAAQVAASSSKGPAPR